MPVQMALQAEAATSKAAPKASGLSVVECLPFPLSNCIEVFGDTLVGILYGTLFAVVKRADTFGTS